MTKDPTVAIQDCLAEIEVLHEISTRMTLESFKTDPIVRRAVACSICRAPRGLKRPRPGPSARAKNCPRARAPHARVRGSRPIRVAVPGADHDCDDRHGAAP